MPDQNYHSARIHDPGDFEKLGTKKITDGIQIVSGKLTGAEKTTVQAYRFDKSTFSEKDSKAWLKKHKIKTEAFESAKKTTSSIFSSIDTKPEIKDNSITIPFVKDGTKAMNVNGRVSTITSEALDSSFDTWVGGIVTVNHMFKEQGLISEVWRDGEFVYGTLTGLSDEAVEVIGSPAYRGVSQESIAVEEDGSNVTKLQGTGVTIVVYPKKPACNLNDGCGVPISSTLTSTDRKKYDVGTTNNVGSLIKKSEITIYLDEGETVTDEELKSRFAREVGWIGIGNYEMFEHNGDFGVGDQFSDDAESIHRVSITVSNLSLNTSEPTEGVSGTKQSRGTKSMAKETDGALEALQTQVDTLKTQSTALTSGMAESKTQLEKKDAEIATLTSTLADKDAEIAKAKDGVGAQITSALQAHDEKRAEHAARETTISELKTVMTKDETFDKFMSTEPSMDVIQSTITALKDALPDYQVGSGVGNEITSTDADVKTLDELSIPSVEFK